MKKTHKIFVCGLICLFTMVGLLFFMGRFITRNKKYIVQVGDNLYRIHNITGKDGLCEIKGNIQSGGQYEYLRQHLFFIPRNDLVIAVWNDIITIVGAKDSYYREIKDAEKYYMTGALSGDCDLFVAAGMIDNKSYIFDIYDVTGDFHLEKSFSLPVIYPNSRGIVNISVSPSKNNIIIGIDKPGSLYCYNTLYNLDSGNIVPLLDGDDAQFLSEDSLIYDYDGNIYVYSILSKKEKKFVAGEQAVLSPDKTKLFLVRDGNIRRGYLLHLAEDDDGLVGDPIKDFPLDPQGLWISKGIWTPDGQVIYFWGGDLITFLDSISFTKEFIASYDMETFQYDIYTVYVGRTMKAGRFVPSLCGVICYENR